MLFLILKNIYLISGNHLATPPNCLTTPQGVATPTLGTTDLDIHRGKTPGTSGPLTLLQLEPTTGSSGRRGTGPPTEPGFSQGFFSILSPMTPSFRSLPLSPLACLVGDTSFPAQSST